MTDTELQRLKCYIVSKQHQLILNGYYGISCNEELLNQELDQALHIYYWYTMCPTDDCGITDFLKSKVNTCKLPMIKCPPLYVVNCNSIFISDSDNPTPPCNTITIQWLQ